jgi:hypothetical protein
MANVPLIVSFRELAVAASGGRDVSLNLQFVEHVRTPFLIRGTIGALDGRETVALIKSVGGGVPLKRVKPGRR